MISLISPLRGIINSLSNNKDFNNNLFKRVNIIFNKIYTYFPILN